METYPDKETSAEMHEVRRLHPMTLLQRILVSLPGLLFLLLPLWRSPGGEAWISLAFALLYGFVALPLIVLQYFRFRYHLTPREVVIRSGVLIRRDRSIPIERIQNIEIEQSLLPRLFGTAKVKIETAGSTSTEGVLDLVSLQEAHRIRQSVRTFQRQREEGARPEASAYYLGRVLVCEAPAEPEGVGIRTEEEEETSGPPLFTMAISRVLLSGVFRFSLLYIALIFSGLEYLGLDPEEILDWFERGRFRPAAEFAVRAPWLTASLTLLVAAVLSWLSGIVVNLNRYYRFRLTLEEDKLLKRHGLLTVSDRTIPLKKIQALIFRSNPLMRRFGWWRLELQTMGLDVDQQGHQVAVPFEQEVPLRRLAARLYPFRMPEQFQPVSRLTIRRSAVRYTFGLLFLTLPAAYFWPPALFALVLLPFLVYLAFLQYRYHGYALQDGVFFVRRGALLPHLWVIPVERFQVFYASASPFQRRLGLQTLLVDTAGAGGFASPAVVDLPAEEAQRCLQELYRRFQDHFEQHRREAESVERKAGSGKRFF